MYKNSNIKNDKKVKNNTKIIFNYDKPYSQKEIHRIAKLIKLPNLLNLDNVRMKLNFD